ncbi:unnamed protein product [Sphagnum jensenii]|uniref:Uncharacterized protein n=1 Tax=Sphagnum jensenii TaxID=128206 RepID=A0ABP0VFR4_9BRYO
MSRVVDKKRIDGNLNVPNSNVNDNGKPNLNNSNAENDNDARVLVRIEVPLIDTLRQPPIWRRASVSLACNLSALVSFTRLSSKSARSFSAVSSALASAAIR